ncbi:MAG: hypothetical protein KBC62_02495 [Candidatus Pacebacteria bacterium]|nr:hypothetical protein [Candidatus Paceibacterota bacterium]MBP9842852.1 hypothetical protein [Candidatus Paceibacterota bacterium]
MAVIDLLMKQFHLSFVALVVTLTITSFVHAQESTSTASTTDNGIFSSLRENVAEIRENVQERVENRQATLDVRVQERITNLAANISNRFDGIIARLENIANRLNKRIEKEASEGKDVTTAKASLEAAKSALNNAKNQMSDVDEIVSDALGSTNPREEWKTVRATFLNARDTIQTAHAELRNTVINLKNAPQANDASASSTEETIN